MNLAVERGLADARDLPINTGFIEARLDALLRRDKTGHVLGVVEAATHLAGDDAWNLAAFLRASGGSMNTGDGWKPEAQGQAGIRVDFKGL